MTSEAWVWVVSVTAAVVAVVALVLAVQTRRALSRQGSPAGTGGAAG